MTNRKKRKPRCPGCGLWPTLCACDRLPTVEIATPIVLVQHVGERFKPTNTGRLLERMVPSLRVTHFPLRDIPFDEMPFEIADVDWRVLFPREDAVTLRPGAPQAGLEVLPGKRPGFVVLDGTWHQCSRMSRRVPRARDLPCVALPPGPPSIWTVRRQHHLQGLCTFEAALRLLELFEPPERTEPLKRAFEIVTARMLFMKNKLPTPEVPDRWPVVVDEDDGSADAFEETEGETVERS